MSIAKTLAKNAGIAETVSKLKLPSKRLQRIVVEISQSDILFNLP